MTAERRVEAQTLTHQFQELSAQLKAQNELVQNLLGRLVVWESTVLKPMVSRLQP